MKVHCPRSTLRHLLESCVASSTLTFLLRQLVLPAAGDAWASAGTKGGLQPQLFGGSTHPGLAPVKPAPGHAPPERHQFCFMLRLVYKPGPVCRLRQWARAEERLLPGAFLGPAAEGFPPPR